MIWSASWTRKNILRDVPGLFHIDIPNQNGWNRYWFVPFGDRIIFPVLNQTILTTPTGSNQTLTSDATWNNSNNNIQSVGAGGSGGAFLTAVGHGCGGGGGAYAKITNFSFATPGTTQATWQTGTGGTAVSTSSGGVAGGNTWFNNTVFATGTTNTQCNAAGGGAGGSASGSGAASGGTAGTTGFGQTITSGGRGGNGTATANRQGTGGGGAAGPNGAGNQGVDASGTIATAGGQGDATTGGIGGTAGTGVSGGVGGTATEFDGSHGCGGGGGGSQGGASTALNGGNAGNYGAGGGGTNNQSTGGGSSGTGSPGIIVLTWTPAAGAKPPAFLNLIGVGGIILSNPSLTRRQLAILIEWLRRS